ncbi:hypothetical protein COEREDRAFT_12725 [Coemansia reversa NRRL 1564]|uniref:Uncharacterized protein n=1 Tax=Coemansia reversa (strain ATCC 12441 / NRRL 1564) TaxID=763665 RepID=A0A2G5B0E9_COERN|nr:hypothetical protein COEREDRAFT_12725 [Coemansia reversa NRRL 1564]|eukprot:PIA12490.1 hypothetical protein COEREDRAFT_12725 [Coemansia reversa NRRL 1564]
MDAAEIELYNQKLSKVELVLSADPDNSELQQLKDEIKDLLSLSAYLQTDSPHTDKGDNNLPSTVAPRSESHTTTATNSSVLTEQHVWRIGDTCEARKMNADQLSQFMASATALPEQNQVLKFTDFKGIVAPLIPQEQKANAKFAPDAVNWLVSTDRLLNTVDCPAKWKVAVAADSLPVEKANRYYADCAEKSLNSALWTNFEKFVAEHYSNAVNYVDAYFRLTALTAPTSVATLDTFSTQVEQYAKSAKLGNQATMLFFLLQIPHGVISCVLMEAKNDEPIKLSVVKTLAANHFGSRAMVAHAPMEIDAVSTRAPPAKSDGIRGEYRRPASFPSYNAVCEFATREEYEDRRKRDVCLACGDAKHKLRKCPQRGPKGQQN